MSTRRASIMLSTTVLVIVGWFLWTLIVSGNRPVLGLDLQGGISVVKFPAEGQDLSTLDTATDLIRQRVDAAGVSEPEVSRQGDTIVVDLPGVKDRQQALDLIGQTGELRFRLVQSFNPDIAIPTTDTTVTDGSTTTLAPDSSSTTAPPAETTTTAEGDAAGTRIEAETIAAVRPAQETPTTLTPDTTAAPAGDTTTVAPGDSTTTTTTIAPLDGTETCADLVASSADAPETDSVWAWADDANDNGDNDDGCFLLGPTILTGRNIGDAKSEYNNGYSVNVEFKTDEFVEKVATPYVGQQVAIEIDGVVKSAPTINPGITGRDVSITGSFSRGEADSLAKLLRYGALPIKFDAAEETVRSVSPTLGKDQLRAGIVAGLIGLALVMLYMILYYRLLGLVVWVGLGLTAMLFFSLVSWLSATQGLTLTLAGVTGLIVSVGVTVDSYVIYFERLKDEVRTGKTIRSSLDTGFHRAFRTIVAADLVSLLGAGVLYLLAEGSVRGFAFFLGLSTIIDLIIAYTVMYPLVFLMARRPALVQMRNVGIATGLDVAGVRA